MHYAARSTRVKGRMQLHVNIRGSVTPGMHIEQSSQHGDTPFQHTTIPLGISNIGCSMCARKGLRRFAAAVK